ncbi:hypothetical protein TNIN_60931 [Trichonephila inaurata madagascariensis]|uniref:Uncharacterized protein n=1 Tax=Trichonephila inaurata madagascariensis TaxID=2747483 RepID=A0A8X6YQL2_9ARAC|nr:hypothetical protein TNIN_60931 [Trichonephila inaurata madagascariensis]
MRLKMDDLKVSNNDKDTGHSIRLTVQETWNEGVFSCSEKLTNLIDVTRLSPVQLFGVRKRCICYQTKVQNHSLQRECMLQKFPSPTSFATPVEGKASLKVSMHEEIALTEE